MANELVAEKPELGTPSLGVFDNTEAVNDSVAAALCVLSTAASEGKLQPIETLQRFDHILWDFVHIFGLSAPKEDDKDA